eukprot:3640990-Pleurochrysis_carterae.AAC.12
MRRGGGTAAHTAGGKKSNQRQSQKLDSYNPVQQRRWTCRRAGVLVASPAPLSCWAWSRQSQEATARKDDPLTDARHRRPANSLPTVTARLHGPKNKERGCLVACQNDTQSPPMLSAECKML